MVLPPGADISDGNAAVSFRSSAPDGAGKGQDHDVWAD